MHQELQVRYGYRRRTVPVLLHRCHQRCYGSLRQAQQKDALVKEYGLGIVIVLGIIVGALVK